MTRQLTIIGLALALGACGGNGGSGSVLAGDGGDGTRACDTLKQADVEAVTGQKAQPGKLDGVHAASDGGAATSMCSYELADGRSVSLLTRVSEGEDLAKAVDGIRNPPPSMSLGKNEDVAGVGKAALWNEATHQLSFWTDGDHLGIVTFASLDFTKQPDLSTARAQAIALAHKMGA